MSLVERRLLRRLDFPTFDLPTKSISGDLDFCIDFQFICLTVEQRQRTGMTVLLILVGVVGSGKSTLSKAIERHIPNWVRANQDDLKDRRSVEKLVRQTLSTGLNVIVDRTNIDIKQRSHWTRIAAEFGAVTQSLSLEVSYQVCKDRLTTRQDHPTIADPVEAIKILNMFGNRKQPVCNLEPIQNALAVDETDGVFKHYNSTSDDLPKAALEDLLERIGKAPGPPAPPPTAAKTPPNKKHKPEKASKDIRGFFKPPT
ncbi:hypothetical protein E3P89_02478 [Wallemia ichthyophaga]|nr:hypothetical protein E3P89_02478 [Wallemia ichthyophaga]